MIKKSISDQDLTGNDKIFYPTLHLMMELKTFTTYMIKIKVQ